MNPPNPHPAGVGRRLRGWRPAVLALSMSVAAAGALAQAYKVVGPDGRVTYTDKPPAQADVRPVATGGTGSATAAGVPYETRQAMGKYPVTLYATTNCAACDSARQALRARGVPFNEFSITTDADFGVFQSRFNVNSFPVVTVGNKVLKGYSSSDLAGYLDAAGYPAQARLTGYAWPAAQPLTPPGGSAPANGAAAAAPAPAAPRLPTPASQSGIQF